MFNIFIYDIKYKNIYMQLFSKYLLYVCVFIYTHNIHSPHTYIMQTKTFIFDAINHD